VSNEHTAETAEYRPLRSKKTAATGYSIKPAPEQLPAAGDQVRKKPDTLPVHLKFSAKQAVEAARRAKNAANGADTDTAGGPDNAQNGSTPVRQHKKVYRTFTGIQIKRNQLGILVIDDNPEVLSLCRRYFAEPIFQVWTAQSATEGAQILERQTTEIDVVILDLIIPDSAPEEIFLRLQTIKPQIPTVVMSGYHTDERITQLLEAGAEKFLKKPFTRKELRATVRHLLED
jgi:CheY-like chemotaxis protein